MRWFVSAGASIDAGTLPAPAPGSAAGGVLAEQASRAACSTRSVRGGSSAHRKRPLWLAASAGSGVHAALNSRLALGVRLQAALALRRPRFAVRDDAGNAHLFHQPDPVVGSGWLELEMRLP